MTISRSNDKYLIGIDIKKEKIEKAKILATEAHFLIADAHNLPFKKERFDLVICSLVLPYVEENVVLKECKRVLRSKKLILFRLHGLGLYLKLALTAGVKYNHNLLNRLYLLTLIPFTILSWVFKRNLLHNMFQSKTRTTSVLLRLGLAPLKVYIESTFLGFPTSFVILSMKVKN